MAFDIQALFFSGETAGVFDFILPGLLIFAFVYGVLSGTKAFGNNRGVHIIISLVIAVLALRVGFVQAFFLQAFPKAGVAIAVILVLMILTSLFIPNKTAMGWTLFGVGAVAFVFVILESFVAVNFFGSNWWDVWGQWIVVALIIAGLICAAVFGKGREDEGGGHH